VEFRLCKAVNAEALVMILDMITRTLSTADFLHTGSAGMTVRHHANDHANKDQPAIITDYGEKSLPNG
jgi:hypothetical protein